MRYLIMCVLVLIVLHKGYSQDKVYIDSVWKIIEEYEDKCEKPCPSDTIIIKAYVDIGSELVYFDPDSSLAIEFLAVSNAEDLLNSDIDNNVRDHTLSLYADALNIIGAIYLHYGNIPKALEYFRKSLSVSEKLVDKKSTANALNSIAEVYKIQGDYAEAIKYYRNAVKIVQKFGDRYYEGYIINNLGNCYMEQGKTIDKKLAPGKRDSIFDLAIVNLTQSKSIWKELADSSGLIMAYNNLGNVYFHQLNHTIALEFYKIVLDNKDLIQSKYEIVAMLNNVASVYKELGQIDKFREYATEAYQMSKQIGAPTRIERSAMLMKELSLLSNDYENAYKYFKEEMVMHDSIINEENYKQVQKQRMQYEYDKQKAIDSVSYSNIIRIKDLELSKTEEKTKRQQVIIYAFVIGATLFVLFSIVLLRLLLQKRKANIILSHKNQEIESQKGEIQAQRDHLQDQKEQIENLYEIAVERKDKVEKQNKEIEDSINYAKRIQSAILPTNETLKKNLPEHFILFKPKDIVSGDFYWMAHVEDVTVFAAADCTGHGVPGAFMSMLGAAFLNDIVNKEYITNPGVILRRLRKEVIIALQQTGAEGEAKDGMDIALCALHRKESILEYAGANNPLYLIRNKEIPFSEDIPKIEDESNAIFEIKGDKMPIAIHPRMDRFTNHEIKIHKGDQFVVFSDGFADQFGGSKGKKLKYTPFKRILLENYSRSMTEQKSELENVLASWVRYIDPLTNKPYEQIDDIVILSVKVD